jgi:hypothetical protein
LYSIGTNSSLSQCMGLRTELEANIRNRWLETFKE